MAGSVLNMIGLARRAGRVESGDSAVRNAIDRGKVKLLILASDSAERTRKNFGRLADDAGIPLIIYGTKVSLGGILGRPARSVVAITDGSLAHGALLEMERGEV